MLAFVVLVLAVARVTRVVVFDEVASPLRTWVLRRWPLPSKPGKLVTCYWCSAVWVALAFSAGVHTYLWLADVTPWHTTLLLPVTAPAIAYAASWILDKEGTADGA